MGEDRELKVGMLTKRAQQKRSISRTNYKERVFALTQTHLAYYEGNLQHRGKVKDRFRLESISFVGAVNDEALQKSSTFLIVHGGCYLYCCAKDLSERDSWIEAIKHACQTYGNSLLGPLKYHPRIYNHGKWQCCGKARRSGEGCAVIDNYEEKPLSTLTAALSGYPLSRSAPGSPTRESKFVASRYSYATSTRNSSSENIPLTVVGPTEQQNMFRDFETALSEKLCQLSNFNNVASHKSKSENNLHHSEAANAESVQPLPLVVPPPKPKHLKNYTHSNGTDTPSLAECCNELFKSKPNSSNFSQVTVAKQSIPMVTVTDDENYKKVVAMYNYDPIESADIPLEMGKEYSVIDASRPHWWIVRNQHGTQGFVPSNYLQEKRNDGIESRSWFQFDMSRQRAEHMLKQDAKEGSFVVRKSTQPSVIYSLSVFSRCGKSTGQATVRHYHIKRSDKGYYFSEKHPLPTVLELITYHKHNAGGLITRLRNAPVCLEPNGYQPTPHLFSNSQWEMHINDLQMIRELGSGQFGVVKLAKYRGRNYVAVKIMKEETMQEDSFIEEAEVMTKLKHRNLVELYGVVMNQRPICIVTEYMEEGCLLDYIRNQAGMHEHPDLLLDVSCQVCDAMKYLEANSIIHRDLAARNCLVGKNMLVKVGDFGLARYVLDDEYTSSAGGKFPIKWAAPEVLNFSRFSSKSDVWSFGILMWELFTGGKVPYPSMSNAEVVQQITLGHRLARPLSCPHDVYNLMRRTWHDDSDKRPAFYTLYDELYEISDNINAVCVPAGMHLT